MKMCNLKTWFSGMILGLSLLAAVPVSADITNSGSTPPPIEFSKVSNTNDVAAETGSQKSSDSGKVYDFKDSKTSGVVTVTKSWDDSMSNDERPVPDISISTSKPGKNPLGYTITYHGNGLTFADGSSENEIVVNDSGKIVSGKYELPGNTAVTWYLDSQCTSKIETDNNGLPLSGIFSDLDLYAKTKTFVIKDTNTTSGKQYFNNLIPDTATKVVFTDEAMPASATLIDVDADGDVGVVAWMEGTVMKVSTQISGQKVVLPNVCPYLFYNKSKLIEIELNNLDSSNCLFMSSMFQCCSSLINLDLSPIDMSKNLDMSYMFNRCSNLTYIKFPVDTSNVTDMSNMFSGCSSLVNLDLRSLNTSNVTKMKSMFFACTSLESLNLDSFNTNEVVDMNSMFYACTSLTSLNLNHFNTNKVTNMSGMFGLCEKLTSLNLTPLNTQNVTDMSDMFYNCSGLTTLDLSPLDTQKVTNMSWMFYNCSGLTALDLSLIDTSKVTNMNAMFKDCSTLTHLSLGEKFAFVGSEYNLPSGTWYSSNGTAYTSDGNSCTIPNNKANTYTRR